MFRDRLFLAFNHKNGNFFDCYWFKKILFSTNSLAKLLLDSLLSEGVICRLQVAGCRLHVADCNNNNNNNSNSNSNNNNSNNNNSY